MTFSWTYAVAAIPNGAGVTLFAGAGGVLRSTDNGATWVPASNGLTTIGIHALTTAPNAGGGTDLYAGTGQGIFRTTDQGATWTNVSVIQSFVQGLEVTPGGAILAGTENDVFRSLDGGATWTETQVRAPTLDFTVNPHGSQGVSLFACGATVGIFKSIDDGVTWTGIAIDDIEVNSMGVVPNGSGGTNVIAGTYSGTFVSTDDGGSWQNAEPNFMALDYALVSNGSGGQHLFAGGFNGVWRSTNAGQAWSHVALGEIVQAMAATENGAHLFAAGDPFGVYRSTNQGATWEPVNDGLSDLRISALLSPDGTNLFAGGAGGVHLSTDQGNTWTSVAAGLTTGVFSLSVSADGSTLLAGSTGFGVWKRPLAEMIQASVAVGPTVRDPKRLAVRTNPAWGPVEFVVTGADPADAIEIFDIAGRGVDAVAVPSGARTLSWSWSRAGAKPGVYLARLRSRSHETVRFVVVR